MSKVIRFVPAALVGAAFVAVSATAMAAPGDAYKRPLTTYQAPSAVQGSGHMVDHQIRHASASDGNPAQIHRLSAYYGN